MKLNVLFLDRPREKSEDFYTKKFAYDNDERKCIIDGADKNCEFKSKEIDKITKDLKIQPAKTYHFNVQLIAPAKEVQTSLGDSENKITHKLKMESKVMKFECITRPTKIEGK